MKTKLLTLALLSSVLLPATSALADTFTFKSTDGSGTSNDVHDLDHYSYYGWSIANPYATALGKQLSSGSFQIKSATLQFKNIYNWVYETNDQLNSFLLSSPPPVPGKSETVPVVVNGVPQGHNLYTYEKVTVATKTNTTGAVPTGYVQVGSPTIETKITNSSSVPTGFVQVGSPVIETKVTTSSSVPSGYTFTSKVKVGNVWNYTYTKKTYTYTKSTYTYTKTTVSTKTNITGIAPTGYTQTATKFIPDMVTLGEGKKLSDNLWERSDNQSLTDVNWGVDSYRLQDINNDPMNPWHDESGGQKKTWTLTYNLDEGSLNALFEYALNGSFGIGFDPDCHYYNDGITFIVETSPIPEPETYAMLLAGLGLLGFAARRRKQKAAVAG